MTSSKSKEHSKRQLKNYYVEFTFYLVVEDARSIPDAIKKGCGIAEMEGYKWTDVRAWETEQ